MNDLHICFLHAQKWIYNRDIKLLPYKNRAKKGQNKLKTVSLWQLLPVGTTVYYLTNVCFGMHEV